MRSPDLKQWLDKKLDRFIRQLLFSAKYIDVLIRFHLFEAEIKRALDAEAKAIGYEIEQIITTPDLEPIRWKEPFPLEVSGTFETRHRASTSMCSSWLRLGFPGWKRLSNISTANRTYRS